MKNRLFRIFTELSRQHISILLAITLFDLILIGMKETFTVCFSLLFPQRLVTWGNYYMQNAQNTLTPVPGLQAFIYLMVAVCFALFVICLVCSYRQPGWLLCAAAMTLLDLGLVIWLLVVNNDPTYYIDIATHVWTIVALTAGYLLDRARRKQLSSPCETAEVTEVIESTQQAETVEVVEAPEETEIIEAVEAQSDVPEQ